MPSSTHLLLLFTLVSFLRAGDSCTVCRCYKIMCARLEDPDIDCTDEFKDSCDNTEDITEENDCNIECDCCLEGQCHTWTSFRCIIYRTYEFSSVLYFILFSVHFFLLWRLNRHFFTVKKKWDMTGGQKEKKGDEQKQFFKYQKFIWIKRHNDIYKKNTSNDKVKSVLSLFDKIEGLRPLSIRNLFAFCLFLVYYLIMSAFNFYVLFTLAEKPLTYFYVCWIQHGLLVVFWVLLFLLFNKVPSYSKHVVKLLEEFEVERNCKVRLVDKIRFIEINFDPQKYLKKRASLKEGGKEMGKEAGKDFEDNEKEGLDVNSEKFGKLVLGDEKPKISINKIKPL